MKPKTFVTVVTVLVLLLTVTCPALKTAETLGWNWRLVVLYR